MWINRQEKKFAEDMLKEANLPNLYVRMEKL